MVLSGLGGVIFTECCPPGNSRGTGMLFSLLEHVLTESNCPSYVAAMPCGIPSAIQVRDRTYTCRQIADGTGFHISLVSRIFRGKRKPSLYTALRLARFFQISIEELLSVANVQVRMPRLPPRRGRVIDKIYDPISVDRYGRPLVVKTFAPCQTAGFQLSSTTSSQLSPELQEWLRAHMPKR